MERVYLTSDQDGHKYIIPYSKKEEFETLMEAAYESEDFDEVSEKYDQYLTGGDYNTDTVPLFAEIS